MFAKVESFIRGLRRRTSHREWAARRKGKSGTGEEPGLLMIQIDGLSRTQLERAMAGLSGTILCDELEQVVSVFGSRSEKRNLHMRAWIDRDAPA